MPAKDSLTVDIRTDIEMLDRSISDSYKRISFGLMIVNNLKGQTPKSRQWREKELEFENSFYYETKNV